MKGSIKNDRPPPPDHLLIAAFNRGKDRGRHRAKYYRQENAFGENRPWQRDAWFAGYDLAWDEAA